MVSCREMIERSPHLFVDSVGDLDRRISSVSSPETAHSQSMVFLSTPKALRKAVEGPAPVLVVPQKFREEAEKQIGPSRTLLITSQAEVAMAAIICEFFRKTPYTNPSFEGIHETAVVSPDAHLSLGARVGPHSFVGAGASLGANTYIGAGAVVEENTEIGDDSVIHPLVYLGHSCQIGKRCEVHPHTTIGKEGFGYARNQNGQHIKIPHQGRVILEDDVHIGSSCTIDRGTFEDTIIETGARLDNQIHIAHNCRVGRNAVITAGFIMAGSSRIGANFMTGGKTVITGHVEVADNVQLAALSVVSKSILQAGQYGGSPLQPLPLYLRTRAAVHHLAWMRTQITKILKRLGMDETNLRKE